MEVSAGGQGLDLVFRSMAPGDSGVYACQAEEEGGGAERVEFELKVIGEQGRRSVTQWVSALVRLTLFCLFHCLPDSFGQVEPRKIGTATGQRCLIKVSNLMCRPVEHFSPLLTLLFSPSKLMVSARCGRTDLQELI